MNGDNPNPVPDRKWAFEEEDVQEIAYEEALQHEQTPFNDKPSGKGLQRDLRSGPETDPKYALKKVMGQSSAGL